MQWQMSRAKNVVGGKPQHTGEGEQHMGGAEYVEGEELRDIREEPSMSRLPSCNIQEGFDGREAPGDQGEASKKGFAWLQHPDGW